MNDNSTIRFLDDKHKWLVLTVVTFLLAFYWLPEQVPFFYSQALPEEKLASKYYLLVIPLFNYLFFVLSDTWLSKLALKNDNMLNLIQFFRIGLAFFGYFLFLRIIILII